MTGAERPLVVEAEPAFRTAHANPYNARLYTTMAGDGCLVRDLSYLRLATRPIDIVHLHWPELTFLTGRPWRVLARMLLFRAALRIARLRNGTKVVWTVHNVASHERRATPRLRAMLRRLLVQEVDGLLSLTEGGLETARAAYPELADAAGGGHAARPLSRRLRLRRDARRGARAGGRAPRRVARRLGGHDPRVQEHPRARAHRGRQRRPRRGAGRGRQAVVGDARRGDPVRGRRRPAGGARSRLPVRRVDGDVAPRGRRGRAAVSRDPELGLRRARPLRRPAGRRSRARRDARAAGRRWGRTGCAATRATSTATSWPRASSGPGATGRSVRRSTDSTGTASPPTRSPSTGWCAARRRRRAAGAGPRSVRS